MKKNKLNKYKTIIKFAAIIASTQNICFAGQLICQSLTIPKATVVTANIVENQLLKSINIDYVYEATDTLVRNGTREARGMETNSRSPYYGSLNYMMDDRKYSMSLYLPPSFDQKTFDSFKMKDCSQGVNAILEFIPYGKPHYSHVPLHCEIH